MLKILTRLLGSFLLLMALLTNSAWAETLLASVTEQSPGSAIKHKLRVFFNEADGTYSLELDVNNVSDGPQILVYVTSEKYDFAVYKGTQMVWRHNMNRFFVQHAGKEGSKIIDPAESISYIAEWDGSGVDRGKLLAGEYKVLAFHRLESGDVALATEPFSLPTGIAVSARSWEDVPLGHWAYPALDHFSRTEWLPGYPEDFFIARTLTRYEFAQATVRLNDVMEETNEESMGPLELSLARLLEDEFAAELAEIYKTVEGMNGTLTPNGGCPEQNPPPAAVDTTRK